MTDKLRYATVAIASVILLLLYVDALRFLVYQFIRDWRRKGSR